MKLWQRERKWRFKFEQVSNDVEIVRVEDPPDFYTPLTKRYYKEEAELAQGYWLVLFAAAWSQHDHTAIRFALPCVASFQGQVHLGIKACSEDVEAGKWYPGLLTFQTPLWAFFADGELVAKQVGLLFESQLKEFIEKGIQLAEHHPKLPASSI